ncbi:MAG: NUDIX hydrolase [Candidatus Jacksonbacteria bacterium]
MQKETVDIIDKNCNILYQTTKQEAHKKGLLHATIISEVKDSQERWMLVKQAADRQDAGQYVSPVGGHVRAGESWEDALKREALEEVGLKDFNFKYVGKVIFNRHVLSRQENHYFIMYEIFSDAKPCLGPESVGYKWFTDEDLKTGFKKTPGIFGDAFVFVVREFYPHLLL